MEEEHASNVTQNLSSSANPSTNKKTWPAFVGSKANTILCVCNEPRPLAKLITLATSDAGLTSDEVRKHAWPILLNSVQSPSEKADSSQTWHCLPQHKDEDQVKLDVHRAFVYYPKDENDRQLDKRKKQLSDLITQVLRTHPQLSYFQGYHDIAQVFLLVLGPELAPSALAHLSLLHIRDFMLPSLSPSITQLYLLPSVLQAVNPQLFCHLSATQPFFALSATLTMYAHDIQEYGEIARLFDFLIAQPAVVSVYFFTIIVLSRAAELFETPADEPEMLHSILSKLPKPLDLEVLISETMQLFTEHPPESLPNWAWWRVSSYSVLKTTRWRQHNETIRDGERMFAAQAKQLKRQELARRALKNIYKHRYRAGRIGLAIGVVALSIWLGRGNRTDWRAVFQARSVWDILGLFRNR